MVYPSFEELKKLLGVRRDDSRRDTILQAALEHWLARPVSWKNYVEYKDEVERQRSVANTVELCRCGLQELLRYDLEFFVTQEERIHELQQLDHSIKLAENRWRQDSQVCVIWTHYLTAFRARKLQCIPQVSWTITLNKPVVSEKDGILSLEESTGLYCRRELILTFTNIGQPSQSEEFLMRRGGEEDHLFSSKKIKRALTPYARKRLYLPEVMGSHEELNVILTDLCALACVYLLRKTPDQKMILTPGKERELVGNFLDSYLRRTFPGARSIEAGYLLTAIIKNCQIVKDYYTFRNYVASTIRGRAKTEYNQKVYGVSGLLAKAPRQREEAFDFIENLSQARVTPTRWEEELSVRQAAEWADVNIRTLYDRIEKGKIPVHWRGGQPFLRREGLEALVAWKEEQKQRYRNQDMNWDLALAWDKKRGKEKPGEPSDSAMRQIRRLRRKGLDDQTIAEKIGREWLPPIFPLQPEDTEFFPSGESTEDPFDENIDFFSSDENTEDPFDEDL